MAIIDLGTFDIEIGDLPVTYEPFEFKDNRAYIINCQASIENPNNIFSYLSFRTIINNGTYLNTYGHQVITKPLTDTPFVFLLPFSNLYDGNGSVIIEAERLPITSGGSDGAGLVTLNLSYDDANDIRTWL